MQQRGDSGGWRSRAWRVSAPRHLSPPPSAVNFSRLCKALSGVSAACVQLLYNHYALQPVHHAKNCEPVACPPTCPYAAPVACWYRRLRILVLQPLPLPRNASVRAPSVEPNNAGVGRCSGGGPTQHAFPTPSSPLQRVGQRPRGKAMPNLAPVPAQKSITAATAAATTSTITSSTPSARLGASRCPGHGRGTAGPASKPPRQGLVPSAALAAAATAAAGPCSSAVAGSLPATPSFGWPPRSTNSHMRTGVSCAAVRGGRRGLRAPPRPVEVRRGNHARKA